MTVPGSADLRALKELLQEIWIAHMDKDSPDYNACEDGPCQWCVETERLVESLLSGSVRADERQEKSPEWGLANAYTIARRRLRRCPESEREWWQHVIRIAEESGVRQPSVLRHALPTEITDGGTEDPS